MKAIHVKRLTADELIECRAVGLLLKFKRFHIGHIDEKLGHAEIEDQDRELVAVVYRRYAQAFFCVAAERWNELLAEVEAGRKLADAVQSEVIDGGHDEDWSITVEALRVYLGDCPGPTHKKGDTDD